MGIAGQSNNAFSPNGGYPSVALSVLTGLPASAEWNYLTESEICTWSHFYFLNYSSLRF